MYWALIIVLSVLNCKDMLNQKNKVLILGSLGNLGSQIAKVMANEYRLLLWDREDIDVLDFALLEKRIMEHRPNIIINCVAYNAVDKCEEDDDEYRKALLLNKKLPAVLADCSLKLDSLLVHFVSDYVFDGEKKDAYIESDETRAISKYGESKLLGEKEVLNRSKRDLKYYLIRTSKLFGPKGISEASKPSFFDIMLDLAKTKKELSAINGEEISCFTYTPDLAKAVLNLIEAKKDFGIYHIVNEGEASWYSGAKYLFELKNIKDLKLKAVSAKDFSRPAKRPKYSALRNTKLPKLRNYRQALKEYLLFL